MCNEDFRCFATGYKGRKTPFSCLESNYIVGSPPEARSPATKVGVEAIGSDKEDH